MPQFQDYPSKTTPSNSDILLIADSAASNATKKISRNDYLAGAPLPADTVDSQAIEAGEVKPNNLMPSTGTTWVWTDFTPALTAATTNPTVGNGTWKGRYTITGKTVRAIYYIGWGSTSTAGSGLWYLGLPVPISTASPFWDAATHAINIGSVRVRDSGTTSYTGNALFNVGNPANNVTMEVLNATLNAGQITNNNPITWANGDSISVEIEYEAA